MPPFFMANNKGLLMECSGFWGCFGAILGADVFKNIAFIVGVLVAVVSVLSAKSTARKKQSSDLLFNSRGDHELVQGMRTVSQLHEREDVNMRHYAKQDQVGSNEAKALRYLLNHYEYVSVGIQSGIYDERMLKKASYNTVVHLYKCAKPFIEGIREVSGRPTIYQEFQWLAKRWESTPIKKKKK